MDPSQMNQSTTALISIDPNMAVFAVTVFAIATLSYIAVTFLLANRRLPRSFERLAAGSLPERAVKGVKFAGGSRITPKSGPGPKPDPAQLPCQTATHQIDRLAEFVGEQSGRVAVAEELHISAGQQLDLASYAIQTLRSEVGSVAPSLARAPDAAEEPKADVASVETRQKRVPLAAELAA